MRKCVRKMAVRSPVLILDCPVPSRRRILPTVLGVSTCPSDTVNRKTSLTVHPALSILEQHLFSSRQVRYFVTMTFYRLCAQSQTPDIVAYDRYRNATGAILDPNTGIPRIPSDQYKNLKPLFVKIAGREFELTQNAQIFPRALNGKIGGTSDYVYIMVYDIGATIVPSSVVKPQCVLGYAFLERYYTVFDAPNRRIGFASTRFTKSEIN
jgi:Eukaryotic aspartyl protease